MLYEVGVFLILFSAGFCGGSVLVPVTIAAVGAVLMCVGKEADDGKTTNTKG